MNSFASLFGERFSIFSNLKLFLWECDSNPLCQKCPCSEFFWSVFYRFSVEFEDLQKKLSVFNQNPGKYRPEKLGLRSFLFAVPILKKNSDCRPYLIMEIDIFVYIYTHKFHALLEYFSKYHSLFLFFYAVDFLLDFVFVKNFVITKQSAFALNR